MNVGGGPPDGTYAASSARTSCGRAVAAIAAATLLALPAAAIASDPVPVALDQGWLAHWDEATGGAGAGPTPPPSEAGWAPACMPVVESGWPRARTLWLRRRLPEQRFRDPVLLASAVDQTLEVWIDGKPIYRLGDLERPSESFATAVWLHLVTLPEDCSGKELTLRIRSSYTRAGVGGIRIGPRDALVRELLVRDLRRIVLGLLAVFAGVLECVVFLRRREQRLHLAFGGFAVTIGVFMLSQTSLAQLIADAPMFWTYVVFGSLYLTPVGVLAFVEELLGPGPASLLRRARQIFVAYAVSALGLAALGQVSLTLTLPPFLVSLGAAALLGTALTVRAAIGGSREARILLLGMSGLLVATVNDILVSLGAVTWLVRLVDEATFVFLLSLGGVAVSRYAAIHRRLQAYSHDLERKNAELTQLKVDLEDIVEARTCELKAAKDELELRNRDMADRNALLAQRAARDSLTGLLNHGAFIAQLDELLASRRAADFPASLLMIDIDHFKLINDRFGHPTGDEALRRIAAVLLDVVREGDIVARYGGEEFTVLFPRCPAPAAQSAAERLREAIAAIRISSALHLSVTASFGIVTVTEPHLVVDGGEMIARADEALYAAKAGGRDRVCFHPAARAMT